MKKETSYKKELDSVFKKAQKGYTLRGVYIPTGLDNEACEHIDLIVKYMSDHLAVVNVLITSILEKIVNVTQDIRYHQSGMSDDKGNIIGYSGRTLDTKIVVPFLKEKRLPSMVESGWLTRSLEQPQPYKLDYRGKIRNLAVKKSFLQIIDMIESDSVDPKACLEYLFVLLLDKQHNEAIVINPLVSKNKYSIHEIITLLRDHFEKTTGAGKARLPVIALYSVYQSLIKESARYRNKKLKSLASHTSADFRSGDIGDIQINNEDGTPFEGIEVKYEKQIDSGIVGDAYEKIKSFPVKRYYILSTRQSSPEEKLKIDGLIAKISQEHGCQVIVNGLVETIKYYLRIIEDTDQFVENYTRNVLAEPVLKHGHRMLWKNLIEKKKTA